MPSTDLPEGARRLPDTARCSNRIQINSESTPNKTYIIGYSKSTGRFECTCPHYTDRCRSRNTGRGKNDAVCKHLSRHAHLLRSAPETEAPKPRKKLCPKAVKPVADMTLPEAVWTPAEIAKAALAFAD